MASEPSQTNQQINSVIVDTDRFDPRFVYYVLRTKVDELKARAAGAATPIINKSAFSEVALEAPHLHVQQRIGSLLGAYDDLIEVNRRRVAVLEEMARGLFEEWFVRFRFPGYEGVQIEELPGGPSPTGWRVSPLAELCDPKCGIQTGPFGSQLHQEDYTEEGVPVTMPKNLLGLRIVEEGIARIPPVLANSLARHILREGDIVYGRRGDIGRRAFVSKRQAGWFCGTGCLRLRPDAGRVAPRYLFDALGTPMTEGAIKGRATGATMPNLSAGVMKDIPVITPPLDVQVTYTAQVNPMMDLVDTLVQTNSGLAASRDLLLPRLISGQLSVEAAERELEEAA